MLCVLQVSTFSNDKGEARRGQASFYLVLDASKALF